MQKLDAKCNMCKMQKELKIKKNHSCTGFALVQINMYLLDTFPKHIKNNCLSNLILEIFLIVLFRIIEYQQTENYHIASIYIQFHQLNLFYFVTCHILVKSISIALFYVKIILIDLHFQIPV